MAQFLSPHNGSKSPFIDKKCMFHGTDNCAKTAAYNQQKPPKFAKFTHFRQNKGLA